MLEFKKEFVEKLENNIKMLMEDYETAISFDEDGLQELANYMSIYMNINTVLTQRSQLEMMRQSQKAMENIDFSKIDVGKVLGRLAGK